MELLNLAAVRCASRLALALTGVLGACAADGGDLQSAEAAVTAPLLDAAPREGERAPSDPEAGAGSARAGERDSGVHALDASGVHAVDANGPRTPGEPRDSDVSDLLDGGWPRESGTRETGADTAAPAPTVDAALTDDRCDVAKLDPSAPPGVLSLSGNLGTHDPALIAQDGTFYLWQTGPRVPGKTSANLMSWQGTPGALGASNPAWIAREVPGASDLWAPDISFFAGQYHLYYSVSTFGSNASCIGHATRPSLATGSFRDQGSVLCSNHGEKDDWNAIDPNAVVDEAGAPWLVFGSFWSGIKAVALNPDGTRKDSALHALASRGGGAIEGPFVVRRCGYYYLFVSFDRCCDGANSTYNIRVGRAEKLLGPYLDKSGKAMLDGGGSLLLAGAGRWRGPGHNAVIFSQKRAFNVYHAYDANASGSPTLRVAELAWDAEGWPVSGGP